LSAFKLGWLGAVTSFVRFSEDPMLSSWYGEQYAAYRRRAVSAWWPAVPRKL
jgi:protein-S-isoprenylcysteine O-methyltransferase Ste14